MNRLKKLTKLASVAAMLATILLTASSARAAGSTTVDIAEVYGGGGNSGSTYKNDFIVLFNRSASPVNITGWSVQYFSATGTTVGTNLTVLSGTIPVGGYYLVQEAAGTGGTTSLPTPDATGGIALAAGAGKVALVNNSTALTSASPTGTGIIDFVGFGTTASTFEGTGPTPAPSALVSAQRGNSGCTDSDNNASDFTTAAPNPRNSSSPTHSCAVILPPVISGIAPASVSTNAGNEVDFTVTLSQGDAPLTYYWYKGTISAPNLIASATTATLTLPSVVAADAANYQVVVSNISGTATSSPVSLTVADPAINFAPAQSQTLVSNSTAVFTVGVGGTPTVTYQWFTGTPGSGTPLANSSHITGVTTATLAISNVTGTDALSYYVTAHNGVGPDVTTPAITLSVVGSGTVAFWDFNNPYFNTNGPLSDWGAGTASISNAAPFVLPGSASDGNDSGSDNGGVSLGWGTDNYPTASVSNKSAGVQFNVSTVGVRNIHISYDIRETTTASKYKRLQYTTDGVNFTDYPASSPYAGPASSFQTESYDLTGFPGVANNSNFGIRLVTEFESTATYGVTNTASYLGFSTTYQTGGTISYDLVNITGDALTGPYNPPSIGAISTKTVPDQTPQSFSVSVSGGVAPLTVTATSLNPSILNAGASGTTVTLTPQGAGNDGVVPVIVKVTGANGDSAVVTFNANVVPDNLPPVVTGLVSTNTLVNTPITIHFTVSDDHTLGSVSYVYGSSNTTLLPNGGISLGGSGGSRTLTLTPANNQLGVVPITLIASDNDPTTPKSTTVNFSVMVRPSAGTVLNDYFNYDNAGSIVTNSGGFWQTHSGTSGQMQVGSGLVTIDGVNNSEDVNAQLIGQPYPTNNGAVLFSSCIVNYQTLPTAIGAYFGHFKDNTTFGFLGRIWASTSNAASGFYRIGIGNSSDASAASPQFPMDLSPNQNYQVVTMLQLSNGFSTLWINPTSQSDTHVSNSTSVGTNLVQIYQYALRESNSAEGKVKVSSLRVGLTFADVVDVLAIQQSGNNAVVTWNNPVFSLIASTSVTGPYTNIVGATSPYTTPLPASGNMFYRLKH